MTHIYIGRRYRSHLFDAFFFLAFVMVFVAFSKQLQDSPETFFRLDENRVARSANAAVPSENALALSPATGDRHELMSRAASLLSDASVYAADADKTLQKWRTEVEPLLDCQLGQETAESQDMIDKLAYVFRENRMTSDELQDTRRTIGLWQRKLENLSTHPDSSGLTAQQVTEIANLHCKCRAANDSWRLAIRRVMAITETLLPPVSEATEPEPAPTLRSKLSDADTRATLKDLDLEMMNSGVQRAERCQRDVNLSATSSRVLFGRHVESVA